MFVFYDYELHILKLFSFYLIDRSQYASFSNYRSTFAPVHSCVTHGSVLGSMLFFMYIEPFSTIADSHHIMHHSFSDDLRLQVSAPLDKIFELLHSMKSCIRYIKAWATANTLKRSDIKERIIACSLKMK